MTGWLNARAKKRGPLAFLSFMRIAKRLGSEGWQGSDFLEFSGTSYKGTLKSVVE
jgi:hypothetical protein